MTRRKYRHVGTFSGCGGSSQGIKQTGRFKTTEAVEFDPNAAEVYRLNHPRTTLIDQSIVQVTGADFDAGTIDLLEGSPPCSKFSSAGRRERSWGKVSRSDSSTQMVSNVEDLFFEFCRLAGELQPRALLAENVPGLTFGASRGYLTEIVQRLDTFGYFTRLAIVDASFTGVASSRRRLFIMGLHKDMGRVPDLPATSKTATSIGDVCPWIDAIIQKSAFTTSRTGDVSFRRLTSDSAAATISASGYGGGELDGVGVIRNDLVGNHPPLGVNEGALGVATRGVSGRAFARRFGFELHQVTIPELKRLSSFPDDYQFTGSYVSRWRRIGNAVPPNLAEFMANHMAAELDKAGP